MNIIYCVRPISGRSGEEVFNYYSKTQKILTEYGYNVLTPIYSKGILRTELEFKAKDYRNPMSTNHAIYNRDISMVCLCDMIYANFLDTKIVSIGSMFELAIANFQHKQIVLVMEKDNIMQHAFVLEAATIVLETEQEGLEYLRKLIHKEY